MKTKHLIFTFLLMFCFFLTWTQTYSTNADYLKGELYDEKTTIRCGNAYINPDTSSVFGRQIIERSKIQFAMNRMPEIFKSGIEELFLEAYQKRDFRLAKFAVGLIFGMNENAHYDSIVVEWMPKFDSIFVETEAFPLVLLPVDKRVLNTRQWIFAQAFNCLHYRSYPDAIDFSLKKIEQSERLNFNFFISYILKTCKNDRTNLVKLNEVMKKRGLFKNERAKNYYCTQMERMEVIYKPYCN